jgi:dolichyl-phosphate beta-glucosyltransferase
MPNVPEVSLVIPAFNEARRLEESVRALRDYLGSVPWSHEVILVIERSTDGTLELAQRLTADLPAFVVIGNDVQRGKGYAVRCGMLAARGDISFFMDADLSTPLAEIGKFLEALAAHPEVDIYIGSRQHAQSRIVRRQSWVRQRMGETFNWILRRLTGLRFLDTQCGFKAFRRPARETIFPRQQIDGFAFDAELLILAEKLGYRVDELPVEWRNAEGSKVHLVRDSWRMLRDAVRARRRTRSGDVCC